MKVTTEMVIFELFQRLHPSCTAWNSHFCSVKNVLEAHFDRDSDSEACARISYMCTRISKKLNVLANCQISIVFKTIKPLIFDFCMIISFEWLVLLTNLFFFDVYQGAEIYNCVCKIISNSLGMADAAFLHQCI